MLFPKINVPYLSLSLMFATLGIALPAQAQLPTITIIEEGETLREETAEPDFTDPNDLRPLTQSSSLLSLAGGRRLMGEAQSAISAQNYTLAVQKLKEARQVFNQLSGFYAQLSDSFSGIDNRISDAQRNNALKTSELRDEATYQLALVHRAQNRPELAVPLLIQIIRSQNPTTDLGKKAYDQLAIGQPESILSFEGGQRLMDEAGQAISTQNYPVAIQKLQEARQVFNQLSSFYAQLAESFSGIDGQVSEAERGNALRTSELRDEATYQLALVHRVQDRPELSVPLLIQIVRSQNPTTNLGKKAYQQLFELGFVNSTYPRSRVSRTDSPNN
nr:hypothetical protein [Lusitaniella coriacea]